MNTLKEILIISGSLIFLGVTIFISQPEQPVNGLTLGAPSLSYHRSLLPIDSSENVGTSTSRWAEGWFTDFNISGTCTGCSSGEAFAWTYTADGNSTSTRLIFGNGFISQASSTVNSSLHVQGNILASSSMIIDGSIDALVGFVNVGELSVKSGTDDIDMTVYSDNQLYLYESSAGIGAVLDITGLTSDRVFTFPDWLGEFVVSTTTTYVSSINATTTTATSTFAGGVSLSGLLSIGGDFINEFAGTGLTVTGNALTADLGTDIDLTSSEVNDNFTDASVLFWGTTGVAQDNTNFNFSDSANRLTATYASSTAISATNILADTVLQLPSGASPTVDATGEIAIDTTSGQLQIYDGTANRVYGRGFFTVNFTYSTSTAWVATTTIPLSSAWGAETWNSTRCYTDVGTLNVSYNDASNRMNLLNASTTQGTFKFSTNNTFTDNEKRYVDVGTPASSPTKISCKAKVYTDAD